MMTIVYAELRPDGAIKLAPKSQHIIPYVSAEYSGIPIMK